MPKETPILIVRVPELPGKRIGVYPDQSNTECRYCYFYSVDGCADGDRHTCRLC